MARQNPARLGLGATALVAFTLSGNTVRRLARLHPSEPLVALTPDRAVRDQLALSCLDGSAPGDVVVVVAGSPPHTIGVTDLLRVHRLGDVG